MFSDLTGIDKGTVSNLANGGTKHPKADFFQAFVWHFPEVNLRWLLVGVGEMYLPEGELESSSMVLREPEEAPAVYQAQSRSVEQLSETVQRLTGLLSDCIEEKERLRMKVV